MTKQLAEWFGPAGGRLLATSPDPVILWDKDSTLAHTLHRQHMIEQIKAGQATWNDYSLACEGDGVIDGTAALMRLLSASGWLQFIVSGANAEAEPQIRAWALAHRIPYDGLILRATGNHQPNPAFKIGQIHALRDCGQEPMLFVEDWPACADQIREATGVPVLVVNPCYPGDSAHSNVPAGIEGSL